MSAKRSRIDEAEVNDLSKQLFSHLATLLPGDPRTGREPAELNEATLTDLGVTSTMAMTLKGWVFHQLEAELTTFQLMKSPTSELLELIATLRKSELGVALPELQPSPSEEVPAPA